MTIESAGINLSAVIDFPDGFDKKNKTPICIIIHGITGNKEEPHLLAVRDAALRAGCVTLRADMYGHGESGGFFCDHTLNLWLDNILSVLEYVRDLDYVSDIYLCGHSQGGCAVMLAAAAYGERFEIAGLIPLSPACHIPDNSRRGEILGIEFDPMHIPDELPLWDDFVIKSDYLMVAQTINMEESIDKYTGPVLIVHGSADESVPIKYGRDAANRYKNSTFVEITGDTHCFDYHADEMAAVVEKWLKNDDM
ncbi:MAG: alpha/beta fold hydrolase [Eubacterium sp.]|nr:alpha/beta fold hydrolase [Eubacterium sp.]